LNTHSMYNKCIYIYLEIWCACVWILECGNSWIQYPCISREKYKKTKKRVMRPSDAPHAEPVCSQPAGRIRMKFILQMLKTYFLWTTLADFGISTHFEWYSPKTKKKSAVKNWNFMIFQAMAQRHDHPFKIKINKKGTSFTIKIPLVS
jgi:hypothetical protein